MHKLCTDFNKMYDVVSSVILLGTSAKLRKASIMFVICLYVCPHGGSRLSLDGCSSNLIFDYFWKMC